MVDTKELEEYIFHIKIFYKNGKHRYANMFNKKYLEQGYKIGTIKGFRKMNFIERFIFRNIL